MATVHARYATIMCGVRCLDFVVPGLADTVSFERSVVEGCIPQRAVHFAARRTDQENKLKE